MWKSGEKEAQQGQASCLRCLKGHGVEEGAGLFCGRRLQAEESGLRGGGCPRAQSCARTERVAWGTPGPPPLTLPGGGSRHQGASQPGLAASPTRFLPESRPSPQVAFQVTPWLVLLKGGGSQQVLPSTGPALLFSPGCFLPSWGSGRELGHQDLAVPGVAPRPCACPAPLVVGRGM